MQVLADLIHIDAAHEYPDVKEDIALYWPLLAPGGILLGDDYIPGPGPPGPGWPGVVQAVEEFVKQAGLQLHLGAGVKWWVKKPMN